MGGLPGLIGLGGGAGGTSFAGPQTAPLTKPVTADQLSAAYTGAQRGMQGQQDLLAALQAQQGIQNQSQVYGQLQGIASGAVNPAQAQFNLNTQANIANQAALMAGQRGAGANVGLMARQAAQQGAGIQQQAVGQEAAQQAANQIAAIGAAGNLATTQAGQQIGQTNAITGAQQSEQQMLLNAMQGYNTNLVQQQAAINAANANLAGTQMQGFQKLIGGGLGSIGAGGFAAAGAEGGEITKMADGGYSGGQPFTSSGPQSMFGQFLTQGSIQPQSQIEQTPYTATQSGFGVAKPKPKTTTQEPLDDIESDEGVGQAKGGMIKDYRGGGKVKASSPKEKAVAAGNNYANDKIPAVLSEHEIVLPRTVTMSKDPVGEAAKFVAGVISRRKSSKK